MCLAITSLQIDISDLQMGNSRQRVDRVSVSRLVDGDFLAFELDTVEHRDGFCSIGAVRHMNEPVAVGRTHASVADPNVLYQSMAREELAEGCLRGVVRKVAHVEFHWPAFNDTLTEESRACVGFAQLKESLV